MVCLTSLCFSLGVSSLAFGRSGGALGISMTFLPLTASEVKDDLLDWQLAFLLNVPLLMVPPPACGCLALLGLRLL